MRPSSSLLALLAIPLLPLGAEAQSTCNARENRHCQEVAQIARDAKVQRALQLVEQGRERSNRELVLLTEIPAPPFKEEARGRQFATMLREAGADSVWTDEVGNVIGLVKGTQGGRTVVLEGHLDTVFPEETDVKVKIRGDTMFAPGIGDDTRGLIVVLDALRAMKQAGVRTKADVLFMGTVGEEGLGDLRGVKHLFREGARKIDSYIAVDGGDERRVATSGIGSHRYRVTFKGPGGHSWGAFGTANPVHALGRAIAIFDERADKITRSGPRTSYNVGRIGGGTSVNSVAFEAWAEVDMRSEDDASLEAIDKVFQESVQQALREQNAVLRRDAPLTVDVDMVGNRPSGDADQQSPLVQRVQAVVRHFGGEPQLGSGSTNSNIPFSRGVPAVTIGRGGAGGDAHALTEWWLDRDGFRATQHALLLLIAEAGLAR